MLEQWFSYKPSHWEYYSFFRHFSAFTGSGEGLATSLENIAQHTQNEKMKEEILRIRTAVVQDGEHLADAFASSGLWPSFVAETIRAGEQSGKLDAILKEIANHLKQQGTVQRKVSGALLTPKIVSFFLIVGFCLLALVIVPRFETMYASQKIPLPWFTKLVFGAVNLVSGYWYVFLALLGGAWYGWKRFCQAYPETVDGWKIKLPIYKEVYYYLLQYRFVKTVALLYMAGQSLADSLLYTSNIVDNVVYGNVLRAAARRILSDGSSLSAALEEANTEQIIDFIAIAFIASGEGSGKIEEQLLIAAADYEDQINVNVEKFSTKISVLALLPMALAICGLYIAVLAPQIGLFAKY